MTVNFCCFPDKELEKRPKLFLVYEDDHVQHHQVVQNFAKYLQSHCQCDVMTAEWHLDAPWVHQDLQKADFAIVVNSEGAYRSYMSVYGQRKNFRSNHSSTGTSTMSSINSIRSKFLHEEHYDNIVMVYFEYTKEHFIIPDICPGYKYKLMKHFTDFLLHIHQLHRAENLSRYDLPLDGNHKQRPEGQQLLESINAAVKYELSSSQRYENLFDRMYSHTSDDSRYDSGLQADISPGVTPESEKPESWPSNQQGRLPQFGDTITINPSEMSYEIPDETVNMLNGYQKSRPYLTLADKNSQQNILKNTSPVSPHICAESNPYITVKDDLVNDDFIPPEDFDNCDVLSRALSEQMQSIVDRYTADKQQTDPQNPVQPLAGTQSSETNRGAVQPRSYDRNNDLYILRVQSGEIPFINRTNEEVVSIGGESV